MYPLVNTCYNNQEIHPIASNLSTLRCTAVGLNRNFPHALLHGPTCLGDFGLPSPTQKNTKHCLNYFLFNMQCPSTFSQKFVVTIAFTQIEVSMFTQFFSIPYSQYGHLASISMVNQIWRETKPYDVILKPTKGIVWVPTPLHKHDIALMDIATSVFNKKGSTIINKCRAYLHLFSLFDLLMFNKPKIHAAYSGGDRPPSKSPFILWPDILRPPKKFWGLWSQFINLHVTPLLS